MTWTNITGTTTISASRAVTLPVRFRSEPIKILALHPGSGIGGTLTIWDENGRSVQVTRLDPNQSLYEAEFYSDVDGFNYSFAADGNGVVASPGISVYLVSRPAADPDIVNGTVVSQEPISAPNLAGGLIGRLAGTFGNSIMRQGSSMVDACTNTVPNQSWIANTAFSLNYQFAPSMVDLSRGYVAKYPKITTAGTTGATEPIWYLYNPGDTIQDGTAIWTMQAGAAGYAGFPGFWRWAQQLAGQPLRDVFFGGVGGTESPDIIANIYNAIKYVSMTDIVLGPCWENDYGRARSLATIQTRWAAWVAMIDDLRSRGYNIWMQTPLPVTVDKPSSSYVRGDGSKAFEWLLRKHREFASARNDVTLVEVTDLYLDPNPANPVWPDQTTLYTLNNGGTELAAADGTHPGSALHFRMAKRWASALSRKFPRRDLYGMAGEAQQLEPNPRHYGTSGVLGSNVTGTVTNSHRAIGVSASAIASVVSGSLGKANQLACTNTVAGAGYIAYKYPENIAISGKFAVGDLIQFAARVVVKGLPIGFSKLSSSLAFIGSSSYASVAVDTIGTTAQEIGGEISTDLTFDLLSAPVKIPAGTTEVNLEIDVNMHGLTGAATIILEGASIFAPSSAAIA